MKGERWDTKKGRGAESEDRGKEREEARERKGKTKKKLWAKMIGGGGEAKEEWRLGQRGRSQIWQYRVNGCQRQSQGCQKREGQKEKLV